MTRSSTPPPLHVMATCGRLGGFLRLTSRTRISFAGGQYYLRVPFSIAQGVDSFEPSLDRNLIFCANSEMKNELH